MALCLLAAALGNASESVTGTAYRYDTDYPIIAYNESPMRNPIAQLQARLDSGKTQLQFRPGRGYLDSVLQALGIDPSSQLLVYSQTSLQARAISGSQPRAIYFNDSTYVAWVQGVELMEFTAMDSAKGEVFYTLQNRPDVAVQLHHETGRCLTCHDTFSMAGGGVPRFLAHSVHVNVEGRQLDNVAIEVTDETPLRDRWGGWYVTGQHGSEVHLGNLRARVESDLQNLEKLRRGNLDSLEGLLDTSPYVTPRSDIVALMVFEHQAHIQNLITRANFKGRATLARIIPLKAADSISWEALPSTVQESFRRLLDPLVDALLFLHAADFKDRITGGSGFDEWFQAQGPRDPRGRSLRELDLSTRLFRYPLSYMVYSEGFDGLPSSARQYVYARLAEILGGENRSAAYSKLPEADRKAALAILTATKPAFARQLRQAAQAGKDH